MTPELVASARAPGLFVAPGTVIPDDASIAPHVTIYAGVSLGAGLTFVGDPTMGRSLPQALGAGIRVLRAARIGSGAILFPPVTIGEEAVVGAAALVRQDVGARTVVVGSPARLLRPVRDDELIAAWAPD